MYIDACGGAGSGFVNVTKLIWLHAMGNLPESWNRLFAQTDFVNMLFCKAVHSKATCLPTVSIKLCSFECIYMTTHLQCPSVCVCVCLIMPKYEGGIIIIIST